MAAAAKKDTFDSTVTADFGGITNVTTFKGMTLADRMRLELELLEMQIRLLKKTAAAKKITL